MPLDLVREPTPYRLVSLPVLLPVEDHTLWLQALTDAVRAQAHADGFDARFERLGDWSVAARTVYFLDLAQNMVVGNGLEAFLAQAPLDEVMGVLAAADEAGCAHFARLYRAALGLAQQEGSSEFLMSVDEDWLDEQASSADAGGSWRTIDHHEAGGTYFLSRNEVGPALQRYVEAQREVLVQPGRGAQPQALARA